MLQTFPRPALLFQLAPLSIGSISVYLGCLAGDFPIGLFEPTSNSWRLVERYRPTVLALGENEPCLLNHYEYWRNLPGGISLWRRMPVQSYEIPIFGDLALLLPTSGSTGDPKLVRLSTKNLWANATAIVSYLAISNESIAVQNLPIFYSYGLSVLNSHLLAGGALSLPSFSFLFPEFWQECAQRRVTSFAGVPFIYESIQNLGAEKLIPSCISTWTQAGGALAPDIVSAFDVLARRKGARFFVMYGQTEATARMAFVPPDQLRHHPCAIGVPVPGGRLCLEPVPSEPGLSEIVYSGANVMLGYAKEPRDLALGDINAGVLRTGDIGTCTKGYFRVTGRLARFAKLFGRRINLADVEGEFVHLFGLKCAAIEGRNCLQIWIESKNASGKGASICDKLARWLGVPASAIVVRSVENFPLTANGKIDYVALKKTDENNG